MPRSTQIHPATLDELALITEAMPEELRLPVQLGALCALRYGEVFELRRKDLDTIHGVVHIRRAVVWTKGLVTNDQPKTSAGVRDVTIPPHLLPHRRRPSRTIGCHARRPPFQDRPRQPGTDAFEGVEIGSYPTAGPGLRAWTSPASWTHDCHGNETSDFAEERDQRGPFPVRSVPFSLAGRAFSCQTTSGRVGFRIRAGDS